MEVANNKTPMKTVIEDHLLCLLGAVITLQAAFALEKLLMIGAEHGNGRQERRIMVLPVRGLVLWMLCLMVELLLFVWCVEDWAMRSGRAFLVDRGERNVVEGGDRDGDGLLTIVMRAPDVLLV